MDVASSLPWAPRTAGRPPATKRNAEATSKGAGCGPKDARVHASQEAPHTTTLVREMME